MQTNGTLVDDEWVDLFAKHQVMVGVSIDGPKDVHDASRPDRRGRGSYDTTVRGLRLLQAASGRIPPTGVLCVANADLDGREVLRHFSEELGVSGLNLLLPRQGHDDNTRAAQWTRYFSEIIDYWMNSAQTKPIRVYMISEIMNAMMSEQNAQRLDFRRANRHNVITISAEATWGRTTTSWRWTRRSADLTSPSRTPASASSSPARCGGPWWRTWIRHHRSAPIANGSGPVAPVTCSIATRAARAFLHTRSSARPGLDPLHAGQDRGQPRRIGKVAGILAAPPTMKASQFMNPTVGAQVMA